MDEREINNEVLGLVNAIANNDDQRAGSHLSVLVGGALLDLNRVANAVEKLTKFELTRVGDVVLGSSEPFETYASAKLTSEEVETIEALRRGDISVVVVPKDMEVQKYRASLTDSSILWSALSPERQEFWRQQYAAMKVNGNG